MEFIPADELWYLLEQDPMNPYIRAIAEDPEVLSTMQGISFPLLVEAYLRGGVFGETFCHLEVLMRIDEPLTQHPAAEWDETYRQASGVVFFMVWIARFFNHALAIGMDSGAAWPYALTKTSETFDV